MVEVAQPRVAIVHDWMLAGGAERVVEQLLVMYPDAPLYTSCISAEWRQKLHDRDVITGYLQWPLFIKIRKFVPFLRQWWFQSLDFSSYDIVISSSGAEAKGIVTPQDVLHINYCHAPTHYYWSRYDQYLQNPGFGRLNPIAKFGLKLLLKPMRKWDHAASKKPNLMIANSTHIAAEVKKYYGRKAVVIHPPIDTERFPLQASKIKRKGFVIAGRQIPYKKVDLAVQAATKLGVDLTVVGTGPMHDQLVKMAGPTISFKTGVSDADMAGYFGSAKAFLFPGLDDFGITPVEAMATGTPVIAYQAGGALDYVTDGKTGLFFEEQSVQSLTEAMDYLKSVKWDHKLIAKKAHEFSPEVFRGKLEALVTKAYAEFSKK